VEVSELFLDDSITHTDVFFVSLPSGILHKLYKHREFIEKPSDLIDDIIAMSIESLLKSLRSMAGNNVLA
jgi:hypothetical protein